MSIVKVLDKEADDVRHSAVFCPDLCLFVDIARMDLLLSEMGAVISPF